MNILAVVALFAAAAAGSPYEGPKTVYILPMPAGLDQYLAQWLTKDHVMQVVADPKAAEVVMTDRLGEAFEQKLKQLRGDSGKDAGKDESKTNDTGPRVFRGSRVQGTIFLVDAKSRQVLWSDYQKPPRSNSDHDLNQTAEEIARKLSGK